VSYQGTYHGSYLGTYFGPIGAVVVPPEPEPTQQGGGGGLPLQRTPNHQQTVFQRQATDARGRVETKQLLRIIPDGTEDAIQTVLERLRKQARAETSIETVRPVVPSIGRKPQDEIEFTLPGENPLTDNDDEEVGLLFALGLLN
jgi:hypothetical protein